MKPEPAGDLWAKLDAAIREIPRHAPRPPGSFTRAEFQEQRGILDGAANRLILKLMQAGKVRKLGYRGVSVYYQMVEEDK